MEDDYLCCICLDELCEFKTNCCRNQIHKSCLINWFLYKGAFTCPICRSEKIRVNLEDILHYKSNSELDLNDTTLMTNINTLVNSYNLEYRITIDLPNQTSYPYNSYLRYCCYCYPSITYFRLFYRTRILSYVFFIPFIYFVCLILYNYLHLDKGTRVNAVLNAD
jgi:hypothetical protein